MKNKAKIVKEVLKNPLASQRDIAAATGLWKSTVQEHIKELPKSVKDGRIEWICDTDMENVVLWQNILQKRLQEEPDKLKTVEIVAIIAEWTKRYTIFRWEATDEQWWLKDPISVNIIVWTDQHIDS